ncbi:hypothetical protein CALVIDRAFT_266205 [Calocera viscosa TUFC12733]|uniref:Uncharacterized protein n=1 Tax=Calocera viscosa (strain TUFC12733) TaxID=1330018 RepID=A0A167J6H5_CALVF|nr:hypothetical protein CALVIDRAFT_266205 [Calocera viscosa TUFC12733]
MIADIHFSSKFFGRRRTSRSPCSARASPWAICHIELLPERIPRAGVPGWPFRSLSRLAGLFLGQGWRAWTRHCRMMRLWMALRMEQTGSDRCLVTPGTPWSRAVLGADRARGRMRQSCPKRPTASYPVRISMPSPNVIVALSEACRRNTQAGLRQLSGFQVRNGEALPVAMRMGRVGAGRRGAVPGGSRVTVRQG